MYVSALQYMSYSTSRIEYSLMTIGSKHCTCILREIAHIPEAYQRNRHVGDHTQREAPSRMGLYSGGLQAFYMHFKSSLDVQLSSR